MTTSTGNSQIETLMAQEKWADARKRIKQALSVQPENHWLLTQLGVTYYEQGKYRESLRRFLASMNIVSDCPLTLWNLAGALDAIGKPQIALRYYTWLLRSSKTANDDPCWESREWSEALKTDCVYRIGLCFQHMNRKESSEHCFRQYINLLLAGMRGTYTIEEAARHIHQVHKNGKQKIAREVRDAIDSTLRDAGIQDVGSPRNVPRLKIEELIGTAG